MAELLTAPAGRIRLPTVLQALEMEGLSARVELGEGRALLVDEGEVVAASHGSFTGVVAALELLLDPPAPVVAWEATPVPGRRALLPLASLLIEGARLADEWARMESSALELSDGGRARLPEALRGLGEGSLRGRSLEAARSTLKLARVQVVDPVLTLLEGGDASLVAPDGPSHGDYDEWLFEGRRQFRAGRPDLARDAFRNALHLRPADPVAACNLRRVEAMLGATP